MKRAIPRIVITGLLIAFLPAAAGALERGKPNSNDRKVYCRDRLVQCLSTGEDECKFLYSDPKELSACTDGSHVACAKAWGKNCTSREKINQSTRIHKSPSRLSPIR